MSQKPGWGAPASSHDAGTSEATTVRFRAPNAALVTVTVGQQPGPDPTGRALVIAREAVSQVAGGDQVAARKNPAPQDRKVDCGEHFWSWAMPEGWPR
jgi:hypothetical protein